MTNDIFVIIAHLNFYLFIKEMSGSELQVGPRGGTYYLSESGQKVYSPRGQRRGGRQLQVGPRGGRYYLSPTGRKIYVQNPRVESTEGEVTSKMSTMNISEEKGKSTWIKPESNLSDQQQKYCRCVLEVADKQSDKCLQNIAQKKTGTFGPGTSCYLPYSVCANSTGTSTGRGGCSKHYNFNEIPDEFLIAYLKLHGKPVPSSLSHADLVAATEGSFEEVPMAGGGGI